MKGIRIRSAAAVALAGAVVAAGVLAGAAVAAGALPATAAARRASVRLEQTAAGHILTDGSGFTLYLFTRDRRNHDTCVHIPGCARVWPELTTSRRPVAGAGLRASLLGTIPLHGRVRQITYAGHPLYTYARDYSPRGVLYIGAYQFGGYWEAVTAAGRAAR